MKTKNTFILFWNPVISNITIEKWQEDIESDSEGWNWSVWDYEKAHAGDRFFLVRCGDNGPHGICMSGYFISEPQLGEDWSGRGRKVYYMDMIPELVMNPDHAPILGEEELMKKLPGFDWTGGRSGRLLDAEMAAQLEKMWKAFLRKNNECLHPYVLRGNEVVINSWRNYDPKKDKDEYEDIVEAYIELTEEGRYRIHDEFDDCEKEGDTLDEAKVAFEEALREEYQEVRVEYLYYDYDYDDKSVELYGKVLELIRENHREQKDKAGKPYIGHLVRVAANFNGDESFVALLHDILEDTKVNAGDLEAMGIPKKIVNAVKAITKGEDEDYDSFIRRVGRNKLARRVKIADLEDNMNIRRLDSMNEEDFKRLQKYLRSWHYLKAKED